MNPENFAMSFFLVDSCAQLHPSGLALGDCVLGVSRVCRTPCQDVET